MKNKNKQIARRKIIKYLNSINTKIYPSELSEILNIDYDLCMSIVEDLLSEEKIEFEND